MTLRTFNNPFDDLVVMGVLQQVLPIDPITHLPNTIIGNNQIVLSQSLIYVQQAFAMSNGPFPAVLLMAGPQSYAISSRASREGVMTIQVLYFDRWDLQPQTLDQINLTSSQDLKRMQSNIESNDSLVFQGQNYAISIPTIALSGYKGMLDNSTVPGVECVRHDMTLTIQVLPYDC